MTAAIKPDDWPPDLLKIHFDALREADSKAVSAALAAAGLAVDKALAAAALAVDKAEQTAEKWRDNANEWRTAMNDREKKFLTIEVASVRFDALEAIVKDLRESRAFSAGGKAAWGVAIGFALAIGAFVGRFI